MKPKARPLILLLATFFMLGNVVACFDEADDDGGVVVQPFTIDIPMNSTNVRGIVGIEFQFTDLEPVDSRFSGPTTMSFPTAGTMRIASGGTVVEGPVTFGNGTCTLQSLPTMDRCDMTINSPDPLPVNSWLPGGLVQGGASPPNLAVAAAGGLLPLLAALQDPTGNATVHPNIGVGGQDRSSTSVPVEISFDDCMRYADPCMRMNGQETTARMTSGGGVTGGAGSAR